MKPVTFYLRRLAWGILLHDLHEAGPTALLLDPARRASNEPVGAGEDVKVEIVLEVEEWQALRDELVDTWPSSHISDDIDTALREHDREIAADRQPTAARRKAPPEISHG